jgi:hypothetical protein
MYTMTWIRHHLQQFGLSLLLLALGVLLVVATFEFPLGATAAFCGQSVTTWSPLAGLSVPIVDLTGFGLSELVFYWSDGCNGHTSSLVPVLAAVACVVGAVRLQKA